MATTTAATTQKEETPRKTIDLERPPTDPPSNLSGDYNPDIDTTSPTHATEASRKEGDESKTVGDSTDTGSQTGNDASDTQKKIRRAERFGVPVQLSEIEKRNSRAERFGTVSASHGSDALKKSEEQKRKARAERFGLGQSAPADEEVKKKARLARFAAVSKTESVEEDKKKARAIRFSQAPSSSPSEVNGKGKIEPKTAIAGKAGGGD